jgi:hypothetical protein
MIYCHLSPVAPYGGRKNAQIILLQLYDMRYARGLMHEVYSVICLDRYECCHVKRMNRQSQSA